MSDLPTDGGRGEAARTAAPEAHRPRWVTLSLLVVGAVVVVFVLLQVAGIGMGDHRPGRHRGGGGSDTTVGGDAGPPGSGRQP